MTLAELDTPRTIRTSALHTNLVPLRNLDDRGKSTYQCPVCSHTMSTHAGWVCHAALHDGNYRYKCNLCGKGFSSTTRMKQHVSRFHPAYTLTQCTDMYECEFCQKTYNNKKGMEMHKLNHHNLYNWMFCSWTMTLLFTWSVPLNVSHVV